MLKKTKAHLPTELLITERACVCVCVCVLCELLREGISFWKKCFCPFKLGECDFRAGSLQLTDLRRIPGAPARLVETVLPIRGFVHGAGHDVRVAVNEAKTQRFGVRRTARAR